MKKVLATRPEHDDTMHYLSKWCKAVLDFAKTKGFKVLDLNQERANRKEVEGMLSKQNPDLVIFNGHGNVNVVGGNKNEPLVISGKNEEFLANKLVYAISCKSGKVLGPKSVKAGASSYIGYVDDFIFFYDPNIMTHPTDDKTAKLFLEPSNEVAISLIKGKTASESSAKSKELFKKNITKLLSSEASNEDSIYARYLWWDMKNQVCLGEATSKL